MAKREAPKARRGNGEGTITEQTPLPGGGYLIRWRVRGTRPDGTYERRNGTTRGSLLDARRAMREAKASIALISGPNENQAMTVGDLLDDFLRVRSPHLRPRTAENYAALARLHITPALGAVKVAHLDAGALHRYHLALAQGSGEGDALGRTRQLIHGVLRQALDHAVVIGVIDHNPARSVKVPPPPPPRRVRLQDDGEVMALPPHLAARLHELALEEGEDPHALGVALALALGMRRGEVYGLRVADLDLEPRPGAPHGVLHIRQIMTTAGKHDRIGPPKTRQSRRTLRLNPRAHETVSALLDWHDRHGLRAPGRLLMVDETGQAQRPNRARAAVERLQKRLHTEMRERGDTPPPMLSYHGLRFTFVSCAYAAGASIEDISRVCGHASTLVTELIYKQIFDSAAPFVSYNETPWEWRERLGLMPLSPPPPGVGPPDPQ